MLERHMHAAGGVRAQATYDTHMAKQSWGLGVSTDKDIPAGQTVLPQGRNGGQVRGAHEGVTPVDRVLQQRQRHLANLLIQRGERSDMGQGTRCPSPCPVFVFQSTVQQRGSFGRDLEPVESGYVKGTVYREPVALWVT